ncbi:MAG: hypothetical protein JWO02_618 [Solirubrobacterales bacterium]|nr:hypothetical protein [Solirubrobacterales bacterium]
MRVPREVLYKEVWAEPMTTVAARYGLSSNFLARVCERLKIPRPARGYWAQIKVGGKLPKPALPAPQLGDEVDWCRDGDEPQIFTGPVDRSSAGRVGAAKKKRPSQHPLLIGVARHFEVGRVRKYASENYLRPYKHNLVDIFSSKDCLPRALAVASKLFLALEDRGWRVTLAPSDGAYPRRGFNHREGEKETNDTDYRYSGGRGPARPTIVFVGSVAIGLSLFEVSENVEMRYVGGEREYVRVGSPEDRKLPRRAHDWTTHRWLPCGRLGLHAYAPDGSIRWERYWREEKAGDMPSMFDAIGKELEEQAPVITGMLKKAQEEAEESRRRWEIERRELARKEEERRKVEEEKARFEAFKKQLEQWRFTSDARGFVAELRELVKSRGLRISRKGPLEEWVDWILERANEADPLAKLRKDVDEMASKHGTWDRRRSPLGAYFRLRQRRRASGSPMRSHNTTG